MKGFDPFFEVGDTLWQPKWPFGHGTASWHKMAEEKDLHFWLVVKGQPCWEEGLGGKQTCRGNSVSSFEKPVHACRFKPRFLKTQSRSPFMCSRAQLGPVHNTG